MTNEWNERYLTARKKLIVGRFSNLNDRQREAVLTTEGPLLLLAGAGSGKTTVLIHRIANLLWFGAASDSDAIPDWVCEQDVEYLEDCAAKGELNPRVLDICRVDAPAPWNVIAITFTNKAAGELKSRLEAMLGAEANDVWAMTFHSACCRILRRDAEKLGYTGRFTIYDTADSERVMKDVIHDMGLDDKSFPAKTVLNQISKAKDQLLLPDGYAEMAKAAGDFRLERIAQAYAEYQNRLVEANAMDFDDLILQTVRLLQGDEQVRAFYQRKFRYVLIDEYQDTNNLQYLLASLLAGRYENICVVGDDDQSIYRFRGATIENILSFEEQYKGAKVIRLEQNYRSTKTILTAANGVIANNKGRKGKKLWTQNAAGSPITVYEAANQDDEAAFVARSIRDRGRVRDCAILYRNNAQSNALEQAFKRMQVPYRIIGGTRFFDRAEIKDMLAYLWVIQNPADDLRLRRIINMPARGIGAKTLEIAQRVSEASDTPLYQVLRGARNYPALEKARAKLQAFTDMIELCASLLAQMPLPDFYDELLIRTGYTAMLQAKNTPEDRVRLENVQELRSSIVSYCDNAPEPSLGGFLEEIALYTDIEQYDPDADAAVMMTMHSAKGMEFPHVFLVGMEEGLFPGMRAIGDNAEIEEERRLCYVAFTRAKQSLTISHARQRMLYGHTTANRPSRFIEEIPPECPVEREYAPEAAEAAGSFYTYRPARPARPAAPAYTRPQSAPKAAAEFRQGDMVHHDAFGRGMVLSVLPTGNDALLEIAFDQQGTKRLMANYAAAHMKKL